MTKGTRVICLRDDFPAPLRKVLCELPVKGHTYTIRAIQPGREFLHPLSATSKVVPSVLLEELLNPPDPRNRHGAEMGFAMDRFAPLEPPLQEHLHEHQEAKV